jgi:hypothetical protein
VRTREPDDLVLHLVEREGVTVVNVGEELFVCLLVAGGFREVEAHESDEGIDVLDCHGLHMAELRSTGVDRSDVGKSPTTSPSGDLIPTIRGSGAPPERVCVVLDGQKKKHGSRHYTNRREAKVLW